MRKYLLGVLMVLGMTAVACAGDGHGGGKPAQGGPGGGEMKLPQEAITACSGKSEGAVCATEKAGAGVCSYTPDKKYFACKPNHRPSGGPGGQGSSDSSGSSSAVIK